MLPLYDVLDHPLLADPSGKFQKLPSEEARVAQTLQAELMLGLVGPAYTETADVDALGYAIALQVLYQMERGLTPEVTKSQTRQQPGDTTMYRDRYLHSGAAEIVSRVTRTAHTIFRPATFGV